MWAFQGEIFLFRTTRQHVLCLGPAAQFEGDGRLWWKPLPEGPKFIAKRLPAELLESTDVPVAIRDAALRARYGV